VVDQVPNIKRIEQKWGFGMAPVKPATQQNRIAAARAVRAIIAGSYRATAENLEDFSMVKGMYSRAFKRDQWDWFTVWAQLGFPSHRGSRLVSGTLRHLRGCVKDHNISAINKAIDDLLMLGILGTLDTFISNTSVHKPGHGFIYILSTREMPAVLKIGYTNRDIVTRVKEINSATGVIIPYGARAAWIVPHARRVESDIHAMLAEYRLRKDREFFQMDFSNAARTISSYVEALESGTEPRL
jgi:hypothetical protein